MSQKKPRTPAAPPQGCHDELIRARDQAAQQPLVTGPTLPPTTLLAIPVSQELITADNISNELLLRVFDAACITSLALENGSIELGDDLRFWIGVNYELRRYIRFADYYRFNETSTPAQRLECANNINDKMVLIRASVVDNDRLCIDYYLPLRGGITRKALVASARAFAEIMHSALEEHAKGLFE